MRLTLPAVLRPLRHGAFARYMAGEFISMVGTWMQMFAQGWLLATMLHAGGLALAGLTFTSGIPMLLLTLLGGRMADRYNKRLILLTVLALQFIAAAVIGWLVDSHQIAMWHIYIAAGAVGIAAAFEVPAVSALVPELVPRDEMANAIAVDRASFHSTRLIGPSIGGYLVNRLGIAPAYYANALSYLALALALFTVKQRELTEEAKESARQGGIREGLAYVRRDEPTRIMILLMAAMTTFVSPFIMIMMPIYASRTLGLQADAMGYLMACSGVGSLIGSLGLLSIQRGRRSLALKIASAMVVTAVCGMAVAHSFITATAAMALLTMGASICFGTANIVIQERAPDAMRGRVSSVAGLAFFGVVPFSGLMIGWLVDAIGMRTTLFCGAAGFALATLALLRGRERLAGAPASDSPAESTEEAPSS